MDAQVVKALAKLIKTSSGDCVQYMVVNGKASPADVVMEGCYAMTDITGLSCSSTRLNPAGGGFPVNLVAGEELPSGVYNISVTNGNLLCFYK